MDTSKSTVTDYVDAHIHMWDLNKLDYPWPTKKEEVIFMNFGPDDLKDEAMQDTAVRYAVFVQVINNSLEESRWASQLAQDHTFIKGIVTGVDITDSSLETTLNSLKSNPLIVGIRHILDFEEETWLSRDDVIRGLKVVEKFGLTFDLLLRPPLLKYIPPLSKELPRLKMVVDHIGKPFIKDGLIEEWAQGVSRIAENPNIFCKLSGLVTEADLENWQEEDLEPYVKHILDCFGPDRCMFGSDWPVCHMAGASYTDVYNIMLRLVKKLSPGNESLIFRENAIKFYGLTV